MQKGKFKFSKARCNKFKDLDSIENEVIKDGVVRACRYAIMGMHNDGIHQIDYFEPHKKLYRYDLATVLSRMLYQNAYENTSKKGNYWDKHLANLYKQNIIKSADPNISELKQWVLLMLQRYAK